MDRKTAMAMGPDIYEALYGPGWEKIRGAPEHAEEQSAGKAAELILKHLRIDPQAWADALAGMPLSSNIEDRRASLQQYGPAAPQMLGLAPGEEQQILLGPQREAAIKALKYVSNAPDAEAMRKHYAKRAIDISRTVASQREGE